MICTWYDLAYVAAWESCHLHGLEPVPGLDLYHADPAQHFRTTGYLDHDLSGFIVSVLSGFRSHVGLQQGSTKRLRNTL